MYVNSNEHLDREDMNEAEWQAYLDQVFPRNPNRRTHTQHGVDFLRDAQFFGDFLTAWLANNNRSAAELAERLQIAEDELEVVLMGLLPPESISPALLTAIASEIGYDIHTLHLMLGLEFEPALGDEAAAELVAVEEEQPDSLLLAMDAIIEATTDKLLRVQERRWKGNSDNAKIRYQEFVLREIEAILARQLNDAEYMTRLLEQLDAPLEGETDHRDIRRIIKRLMLI
jgi:hypothetical protein